MPEPEIVELSWESCLRRAREVAYKVRQQVGGTFPIDLYPVPRGGIHAAQLLQAAGRDDGILFKIMEVFGDFHPKIVIVDDIIDSGKTRDRFAVHKLSKNKLFVALVDKTVETELQGKWISFPWERMKQETGPQENVRRILEYIGEDPDRPGLKETPDRVVKAYAEIFSGYKQDPNQYIKVFEETVSDAMVLMKDVEFYSRCEHHMEPFFGKVHIAYLPTKTDNGYKVLGLSKLCRVFDTFAKRLQIQERLCHEFVHFLLSSDLRPLGVACVIDAVHFCVRCRGVGKQNSIVTTSSLEGVFRTDPTVRAEFYSLLKG